MGFVLAVSSRSPPREANSRPAVVMLHSANTVRNETNSGVMQIKRCASGQLNAR